MLPLACNAATIGRKQWWSFILGAPAGYIPAGAPVERLEFDMPEREYLPWGPGFLRAWYVPFCIVMVAVSLALKAAWRIV